MKSQEDMALSYCRSHITALVERSSRYSILHTSEHKSGNKAETDAQIIYQDTDHHIRHQYGFPSVTVIRIQTATNGFNNNGVCSVKRNDLVLADFALSAVTELSEKIKKELAI